MAKKTRKTDAELTTMLKDWYLAAASPVGGGKWRERARKAMQFYDGSGQWEDGVTATLRAEGKPALTINRILPVINVIWGQQQKNRTEISLEARKRGTKAIAELGRRSSSTAWKPATATMRPQTRSATVLSPARAG